KLLQADGVSTGVVNMRFLKPLDTDLVLDIAKKVKLIITVEENTICGGLSTAIKEVIDTPVKVLTIALPDKFIEHGSQEILRDKYGLTAEKIYAKFKALF
ncbi:MAG: transketolase C-terminal domain-containing protein, partial [Elusimicrobiota bacterium]|nr:transketolase C-terminal domain-containing protein [Elusimicrobiota bacterium]